MKDWKIGIIGVGMVGTQLKRWFEENGYKRNQSLFLYDIDPAKEFFDNINNADIIFICVPTPRCCDGECDMSAVKNALLERIDIHLPKVVVIKSTILPGMTEFFQRLFSNYKMLFNPEFLTEKRAWEDFIKPDRQIVGFTNESLDAAHEVLSILPKAPFMSPWGIGTYEQVRITATEAEIIKYGGNVYFARKVNFANLFSLLCLKLGADYENVRKGMSADFRIGDSHLDVNYGGYRGFGGYCLPKDLDAMIDFLSESRLDLKEYAKLLESDRNFNNELLASQGLTVENVSQHNYKLKLASKKAGGS